MLYIIMLSVFAGILGTLLGGIIGIVFKNTKVSRYFMGFSAGFMLAVCAFELIGEAVELQSIWLVAAGFVVGALFVMLVCEAVEKHEDALSELGSIKGNREKLVSGLVILLAIALHNLPEGLAIGGSEKVGIGISVSLLIGLHNIPEGAAMSVALNDGGMKKWTSVLMCAISGIPTVLGAIVGKLLSDISPSVTATCLGLAAGAMYQAVFGDIFPKLYREDEKNPSLIIGLGFLAAMIFVYAVDV